MKKLIWGIGLAVVIIVVGIFFYFYNDNDSNIINPEAVNAYSAIKGDYLKYNPSNLDELSEIEQDELYSLNSSFYCNNNTLAKVIVYSSSSADKNLDGGWSRTEIFDCKDYYYIGVSTDAFPTKFYGPFDRRILIN